MDTPELDHAAAMLAIRRLTAQRRELLEWAFDATGYDFHYGAEELRARIEAGEFGPWPQGEPRAAGGTAEGMTSDDDYSAERRARLSPEGKVAVEVFSRAARQPMTEDEYEQARAESVRLNARLAAGEKLGPYVDQPDEFVDVDDDEPEPDLSGLVAHPRPAGRTPTRCCWLLYDCGTVVAAFSSEASANAARKAYVAKVRAELAEEDPLPARPARVHFEVARIDIQD
jgi:hypothetical protein